MLTVLVWLSYASFLIAVYYTLKLSKETGWEKYWVFFFISALGMGIVHSTEIPYGMGFIADNTKILIEEVGMIVSSLSLAYASYGLYKSMKIIRKKLQEE